jgi:hypothetical protein
MSNISLVKLGKYTTPTITENKREKYVAYGDDNNYYATLLESKQSPTNSALINGISDMIYGRGLYATDAAKKPDEYAMMVQLFTEDLMRKISDDFYTLGQASFQVIYDTAHTKVMEVAHMPIQNLRPEKMNDEGDIEAYYYCDDWANAKINDKHDRIPVFGSSKEGLEVYVIRPYKAGFHYFSPVEYQSGLDYAFVEIELAKFHLNNIFNKFSANMIINFNNGVPEEDQQRIIEGKIKDKFTGTEGDSVIVAFNDSTETAATIESVNLPDAHNQYQFIAEEASRKIMVSHRVVSPLLFGLPQNGGLGSNADEIKMAATLFDNTVVKPMQRIIIEAVNSILSFNDVSLNVFMLTSQPLDFTEMEVESVDDTTAQETSGVELSKQDFDDVEMLESLNGEELNEDWELVESREWSDDNESIEDWASRLIKAKKTNFQKFADFITSKPSRESQLDKSIYKVRYSYQEKYSSENSRQFCKSMMARTRNGVVYRLEDIDKASRDGINKSFGHNGQAYDLFKYKGGVSCGHFFAENLYRLKKKTDGSYVEDKALSSSQEVDSIPKSYKPTPRGRKEAAIAPKDMPNNGHHPNYKG